MNVEQLKKQSANLFNLILAAAVVNMLSFFGTSLYFSKTSQKLKGSDLKTTDPTAFEQQLSAIKMNAMIGFAIALLALAVCIYFAIKRMKVAKLLYQADQDQLDKLDIK